MSRRSSPTGSSARSSTGSRCAAGPPAERQAVPEPREPAGHQARREPGPPGLEEDVADQEDDGRHSQREEDRAGDRQAVGGSEHLLLVAFAPAQPVVRRRRDQQDRGRGGREKGDEEEVALELGDPGPAVGERDRQQEREQHLHPGQRHPELVQELDQLAIEVLPLALAHRKRSRSGGITSSRALPSPRASTPLITAAGTPAVFPITSSAAPASSSARAITVAWSS